MAQTNFEHAKDGGIVYVKAQGVNNYQTPAELMVAADAVEVVEFEYELDAPKTPRKGQTGTQALASSVHGMRSGTWRMLLEIAPSGTGNGAPDWHVLLTSGLFGTSSTTPTASTINITWTDYHTGDVDDASGMAAGDVVGFTDSNSKIHAARILSISTNTLTLEEPLTFLPADGTAVTTSNTYTPTTTCEETAATLWHRFTHGQVRLGGCVANAGIKLDWGKDPDAPTIEFSGTFREYGQGRPTTLNGGIDNSQATMIVSGTDWKGITKGALLTIQAEGANTDEVVYVTATPTSATIAIERNKDAAGASAHADAAVIVTYEPASPTISTSVVSPDAVTVRISEEDSVASVEMESATGNAEITGGIKMRERAHGDDWKNHGYVYSSDMQAKTSFSAFAEKDTWDYYYRHDQAQERPTMLQFGDTTGTIMAVPLARQVYEHPKITSDGEAHVGLVLDSMSRGSRTALALFAIATL